MILADGHLRGKPQPLGEPARFARILADGHLRGKPQPNEQGAGIVHDSSRRALEGQTATHTADMGEISGF